jgi:hypothetical protein
MKPSHSPGPQCLNIPKKEPLTADLSTALRSGRDDKGEGGCGPGQSLATETADLSTALRPGRDDKGEGGCGPGQSLADGNRRSLHCASSRQKRSAVEGPAVSLRALKKRSKNIVFGRQESLRTFISRVRWKPSKGCPRNKGRRTHMGSRCRWRGSH